MPHFQYSVLVGLILSDAHLRYVSSHHKNVRLEFGQSIKNKGYFWFVFNLLSHYCSSFPNINYSIRNGTHVSQYRFATRALPCFTELHNLFYVNKIKVIPHNIYEILTPLALAHHGRR